MGKKIMTASLIVLTMLTLSACGSQNKTNSAVKSTTSVSQKKHNSSEKQPVSTDGSSISSATTESGNATKDSSSTASMNFKQIQTGDYTSLQGNWKEIAHTGNGQSITQGGVDSLTVSQDTISAVVTIKGGVLTDTAGDHQLDFQNKNGVLTANLADASNAAINWSVTFYPKNTTREYNVDGSSAKNTQNMIVIWTSNNSYTEIFAQTPSDAATTPKTSGLDLTQIAANNFSSLVGTWKNAQDGKTIVVTNQTMNKPANSSVAFSKGAVVSGADQDGYPEVITPGSISNGYMEGGLGTFTSGPVSSFAPLAIVPKNVKLSDSDDSDTTRDRLIVDGGQSGIGSQAYYKE